MTPRTISKNWDLADLVIARVDSSKMISPLPELVVLHRAGDGDGGAVLRRTARPPCH